MSKKWKPTNYWSLCHVVVKVPNVSKVFWEAMHPVNKVNV